MNAVEIEAKFRVADVHGLDEQLHALGFHTVTPRTFESNTLYDTADRKLRAVQSILRIRKYGDRWVLTHKSLPPDNNPNARHKRRVETETEIADGEALGEVFERLGYQPVFVYEKWRAEYEDGTGHCVVDETPIGAFAELEGPGDWIDAASQKLGLEESSLMTLSYGRLFERWCRENGQEFRDMTFAVVQGQER